MRKSLIAALVAACVLGAGYRFATAQGQGGAFLPNFNYTIGGLWNFTNATGAFRANGTTITASQLAELRTGGVVALDGSNPTSVVMSPLATIDGCSVTIKSSAAPGLDPYVLTTITVATAGQLDIYAWKATSSSDPTLVASTNTSRVDYACIGR